MIDRRTEARTACWTRWLLAVTLCLFAFGYGFPTGHSAYAASSHAAMDAGCPDGGTHRSGEPAGPASAGCCIAHCLPAIPGPLPPESGFHSAERPDAPPRDDDGEGWAASVLLPPPRA